jgi:hypothetical protein
MNAHMPPRSKGRRVLLALTALMLLNQALAFTSWWPTPAIVPDHRIAPEFVGLWLVVLGLVAWRGSMSGLALGLLTGAYLALVLGRYLDVIVPTLFGRSINLYWDGLQIPRFLWISAQERPAWQVMLASILLISLFWLLWRSLRWAIAILAQEAAPYAMRRRWALATTAIATMLVGANLAGVRATWPIVSKPVIPTYARQAQLLTAALLPAARAGLLPGPTTIDAAMSRGRDALAALAGRDFTIVMLESFGAMIYDDPRAAPVLEPVLRGFAADIEAGGRGVVSAFFRSPTFAGGSDLAQLGLLSAMDLSNPMRHDVLLTTDRPTLVDLFRRNGYETFGFYPGVRWDWPELAFYRFDRYVDARDLDYRGPPLGYWLVPDQYAAARFEQLHPRDGSTPPRFVFFPTSTTHLPFSPVPPLQRDPQRLLGPEPFDPQDLARALAERPNWLDMFPDYLRMVEYGFGWVGDWLRQPEPRETVYLLVGDHQPAASVTGEGASWDVPAYIVSSDAALLARLVEQGFTPGVMPARQALGGLHQLTDQLLRAFSGPEDSR